MESLVASCFFPLVVFLVLLTGASATTFTFINSCPYTVWPGILSNAGSQRLETTGFELPAGSSRSLPAPTGWSGRFWGRTGCSFSGEGTGDGACATADCGSGEECNGAGAAPPATLVEFTLASGAGLDFYDVSLVDGYNLPIAVTAAGGVGVGGAGDCAATGCAADVNSRCPAELRVAGSGGGVACRSACGAFGRPEYCCSGEYGSPATCRPSMYSEFFKHSCPRAYSYAYDDGSSTFTCSGAADYQITFCPASTSSSKKSNQDSPWTGEVAGTPITYAAATGEVAGTPITYAAGTADNGVMLGSADEQNTEQNNDPSFLANLAIADASTGGISFNSREPSFISVITLLSSSLLYLIS